MKIISRVYDRGKIIHEITEKLDNEKLKLTFHGNSAFQHNGKTLECRFYYVDMDNEQAILNWIVRHEEEGL